MVEQRILEAFEMMWGPFPEPVMLIHRDRTVLAVNDFARSMGVQAGIKCFSLNPEAGRRPLQALQSGFCAWRTASGMHRENTERESCDHLLDAVKGREGCLRAFRRGPCRSHGL